MDPVKVAQGRTLGDPETVHYGLVPRANRGLFGLNELPDLAERIQVALFNVLEERDIQVRGYSLRLPLDVFLVATANPEDYTNRGRIITPLKDRFGAEIRTHYLSEVSDEVTLLRQEAGLVAEVGDHLLEVLARFVHLLRESSSVDQRSGVSARFAIAAAEGVAASALRRAARTGDSNDAGAVARVCDLGARPADAAGQDRVRDGGGGPRARRPRPPAPPRGRGHVPGAALGAGPVRLHVRLRRGRGRRDRELVPAADVLSQLGRFPGWRRSSTASATATPPPAARSPRPSSSSSRAST